MAIGKETILGRLRDEGVKPVLVNRMEELLGAFGDNVPQFCALTRGRLAGAYNSLHPEASRGLGSKTFRAFERFAAIYRELAADARVAAKAVVQEQERREAEKAEMRVELLDRELEADLVLAAMDALEKLGSGRVFPLKDLLEFHDRARAAKAARREDAR